METATFTEEPTTSEEKKALRARRQEELEKILRAFPLYYELHIEDLKEMAPEQIFNLRRKMEAPHKARVAKRDKILAGLVNSIPIDPNEKWACWNEKAEDVGAFLNAISNLDPPWEPMHFLNSTTGGFVHIIAKKKYKGRPKGS